MVVGPPFESPVSLGRCALVADDDASMRDVLRTVLTGAGYTVLLAATGREALSLAANLDAVVAIIDLAMPDGDGLETCLGLRKIPRWRNVPILVLSHYHTEKAL
jgi:CheY-like chemotaxis protein